MAKRGNIFTEIEVRDVARNTFDLSHDKKMSLDMGWLIPSLIIDTIPGDKFSIQSSQLIRMAPMLAPIMHRVDVYQHFFFVPNRIVWAEWEDFITGGEDGLDATPAPYIQFSDGDPYNATYGSLADYLGIPFIESGSIDVSAIPFAAYQKIYDEYYRDQNLVTSVFPNVGTILTSGDNTSNFFDLTTIQRRAWEHDYFTSCLPWTQKGVEATIPLGSTAPIEFYSNADGNANFGPTMWRNSITGAALAGHWPTTVGSSLAVGDGTGGTTAGNVVERNSGTLYTPVGALDNSNMLRADLSGATAASINELRQAIRLQEWLEKNARGGSRYIEQIKNHFNVKSSDGRLQRPEYLGGGKSPVSFSEVLQTSESTDVSKQGNMAGHGVNVGSTSLINYFCEEHGYIIGIMSVVPKTSYSQGLPRHFRRFDKLDYPWPTFANLGEQEVYKIELYGDMSTPEEVFGYIPRYSESKYMPSTVHGDFKDTLKHWHMGRIFSSTPALNSTFINANPTTRIFANEGSSEHKLYAHVFNNVKASRKLPVFGTPLL